MIDRKYCCSINWWLLSVLYLMDSKINLAHKRRLIWNKWKEIDYDTFISKILIEMYKCLYYFYCNVTICLITDIQSLSQLFNSSSCLLDFAFRFSDESESSSLISGSHWLHLVHYNIWGLREFHKAILECFFLCCTKLLGGVLSFHGFLLACAEHGCKHVEVGLHSESFHIFVVLFGLI